MEFQIVNADISFLVYL